MADYGGLDPSVMQYVQGGGMPPMAQPMPDDPNMYGLPPQVVSGVQNGFAPVDQVTASTLGPRGGSIDPGPQPMPQLPPASTSTLGPRGRNNFGVDPSVAGAPGSPEVADTQVPSVTGGALPTQDAAAQPIATQPLQPDQTIGTAAPLTDKQVTATNKLYAAQQAHAEAFANSPEGLAAKADAMNQAAIDKERQADTDAAAAQQAQDAANATAIKASNERQAKQDQLDAAKRASDMATTQKYADQYAQQVKDAADYKVNTDRSVNTAGAIAIALSGIGQAISHQHGPNAAFQIISDNQDKQIADQWAKKKSLGDTAAGTKDLLETSRQTGTDDRNNMDLDRAAAAKRDADQIREIAAQFKNPADKAHADAVAAMSDKKSADLVMVAANRKLEAQKVATDQANKVAERGIQWAGIKQNDTHFNKTLDEQKREHDLQRQDKLDDLEKQYTAMGMKALADKTKEIKTSGIFDRNTAMPLIDASNPAAQPALLQAKRLDMQAAAATDPAQQAALTKQAADLRNNISIQYGATIDDKDGKIKEKLDGAQRLINTTQRIRDALDDGSITDRNTRAALKTEADNAFTAWAETNGVKASSREYEVYKDAVGKLDGITATNVNEGPLKASLDALDKGTQNLVGTTLRGRGVQAIDANGNPWTMTAEKAPQATQLSGTTAAEVGANAEPGVVTQATGVDLRHPFTSPEARDPLNVENAADTGPSGLTKEDDSKVLGLIKTYGKVSPDENQRVVSNIVNVVGDPGDDPRKQALANATITRVKAESPLLYKKVLEALPADRRKEITQFDLPPVVLDHVMGRK